MIKKENQVEAENSKSVSDYELSAHEILLSVQRMFAVKNLVPGKTELVSLETAAGRVLAEDINANFAVPLFDESMRDGYAVGPIDYDGIDGAVILSLVGETGAGDSIDVRLGASETWKVMTGGKVPDNCCRVVPKEWCRRNGKFVSIDSHYLAGPTFVIKKGSLYQEDEHIVSAGEAITPATLIKIANSGSTQVRVYVPPRVCFCCTGKELVEADAILSGAKKISSNQHLLGALLKQYGCIVQNYGIVGDEEPLVAKFFKHSLHSSFDLVLSTGGTGGGDFDLMEKGFTEAGGTLICNSLDIRPGKSLVVGVKGTTIYIGLPGPPRAAHTVFLEIVAPLLMTMKGLKNVSGSAIEAIAEEDIKVKTRGSLLIKEGVLTISKGICTVRKADMKEAVNCNILISPGRDFIAKGDVVEIHMRESLWFRDLN